MDHGPLLIGTCSDIEVVGAITAAAYTPDETNPNSFCTGYELSVDHSWEFESLEQQLAVIAYLRTLPLNISE
ncbi:hypothetical protein [Pseudobacteriovorax antillogorgiicola]|uniref:Uncharacterized protein n=1 Tax=Pseudobacteriovorax antillogorgiicola TaxID=1513793 RepID=A0A1Y6BIZ8_9BACT|nr:hypothetical protein [Pseudobacteriovorax antillogorgiicola]TCS55472.1 hypothetical protein EDD56_105193 [Pseudobacteriovorax antillogorgiicola]SMF12044.1 hypothetical protein SAMN06296036_105131 [Pseudobacteriovorax antillogorgiicola]